MSEIVCLLAEWYDQVSYIIKGRATLTLLIYKTNLLVSVLYARICYFKSHRRDSTHDHFTLAYKLEERVNARMLSLFGVIADYYTNHYSKL
jgi:hypothetical protein